MDALRDRRVVVCVGPGGVGKTTIAATLAVRAALEGQRVLVVTIDPARRLANSLGLERLGNVETLIGRDVFSRASLTPKGELWAMMLDVKRTSDEVILRHATSSEQAERIFANRFYQTASTVLAGSQEYLAMEKLCELYESNRFDLVVLDTPPTAHALDFLDAPNRVLDVLSNDALRWLATPAVAAGRIGVRAVGMGSGYIIRQISKFTGIETLKALAELMMSMQGMYDGFKDRAIKVKTLLASSETAFVLVTAPGAVEEATFFHSILLESGMPVGAVVVNRVHPDWRSAAGAELDAKMLSTWFERGLAERLATAVDEHQVVAASDRSAFASLCEKVARDTPLRVVPILDRDVHDISGLALMARCLFERDALPAMLALPSVRSGTGSSSCGAGAGDDFNHAPGSASQPSGSSPTKPRLSSSLMPLLLLFLGACHAHRSGAPAPDEIRHIEIEDVTIIAGDSESLDLATLNDQELFQEGASAFAAGDLERAARAFSLLVTAFPESDLQSVARYNAGFSLERAGEYLTALDFYEPLLDILDGRDWLDTMYRLAESLYHLEDYAEAARVLGHVLSIEGLPANDRLRALAQQGACLLKAGHEEEAMHSLRSAVGRYHIERRASEERVDVHFAAQAQFHLGEIFRLRFERARLDPAGTDLDTLADDLEHKSQLLLSAQGHYLRTIRMGAPEWAAAAGHQVGRLYEALYQQITSARMPTSLASASERLAYMELLREKVQVLLEKALSAYEKTLSTAERIGIEGAWRARIEVSLERVRSLLLDDESWISKETIS